ncbi:hypothetical protein JCM3775_003560 [Rhodotorula graminis]
MQPLSPPVGHGSNSSSAGSYSAQGSSAEGSPHSQARSGGGFSLSDSGYDTTEHAKLDEWAPPAPAPERLPPSQVPHLPNLPPPLSKDDTGKGTTSKPYQAPLSTLQASISYSLSRLLSLPRFAAYVATPLGYAQFSSYLASLSPDNDALADLELWKDTLVLSRLTKQAGFGAKGIYQAYLVESAKPKVEIPDDVKRELFGALRKVRAGAPGLDSTSKHLLTKLFAAEFERFVKARLLAHTKTQLRKYSLGVEDRGGIGSAFLLTNPRLRDDPIVLVSPGFCELTGYSAQQIIGRNCRFLQGKATAPEAVGNIRKRLEGGDEVMQIVLNYRADGTPFLNLLHVLPLRDLDGNLAYFLGGQTDMTRALTTGTDLSLILPEDVGLDADMGAFSPAVQLEAREAAAQQAPQPGTFAAIDIPDWPVPPAGPGHEHHHKDKGGKKKPKSDWESRGQPEGAAESSQPQEHPDDEAAQASTGGMHGLARLLGCGSGGRSSSHKAGKGRKGGGEGGREQVEEPSEGGRERQQGKEPLVAPTQKDQSTTMPLEKRLLDVQVTYERLAVVKRQTREILYTTSGFLRSLGLPGTTRLEVSRSPLVFADLLDMLVAPSQSPTSTATKDLRARVAQAFRDAIGLQVECGLQFRKEAKQGEKGWVSPLAVGRLHLAPLLDLIGECTAFTAVFG